MTKKQIELSITGRVQGVYYRKTITKYASQYNIDGYIENLTDGSVYCLAQGTPENLNAFLLKCKKGSIFSRVHSIKKTYISEKQIITPGFFIQKKHNFIRDQKSSFSHLIKNMLNIKKNKKKNTLGVIPKHIVIIPNGNRTWAKKKGLKVWAGYRAAYHNINSIISEARRLNIPHITIWGFSTENWKRDNNETIELFKIIALVLKEIKKKLIEDKIRFNHLGRKDRLSKEILDIISDLEHETQHFTEKSVDFALDYGGRDEILRAVNKLLESGKKSITEKEFSELLDTKNIPDPDLIIRTANEKRLSGMMPWQATYAEYYFTDIYFPDFTGKDLIKAVIDFNTRKRTFGGDVNFNK